MTFEGLDVGTYILVLERPGFTTVQRVLHLNTHATSHNLTLTMELVDLSTAALSLSGEVVLDSDLQAFGALNGADLSGVVIRGQSTGRGCEEVSDCEDGQVCVEGGCYERANLCGLGMRGASFVGADLSTIIFEGSDLSEANFTNVSLVGASLTGANMTEASFFGANLQGAVIGGMAEGCEVGGEQGSAADLRGANFSNANLTNAFLTTCFLRGVNMAGANLTNTTIDFSDLSEVNLDGALLSQTLLFRATLSEASMRDALLINLQLDGVFASGIDLSGSTLATAVSIIDIDLSDANLSGMFISLLPVTRGNFEGANLSGSTLGLVTLSESNMRETDLSGAVILGLTADNTDFSGANLRQSRWEGVSMVEMDFTGADMHEANFLGVDLSQTTLDDVLWEEEATCPDGSLSAEHGDSCPPELEPVSDLCTDAFEPNDAISALRFIEPGVYPDVSMCQTDPVDAFAFPLSLGQTVTIRATPSSPSDEFFMVFGSTTRISHIEVFTQQDDTIVFEALGDGLFALGFMHLTPDPMTYELSITIE